MGREAEDRASPILVGNLSDRWLITHPVPCKRYSASMDRWKACGRRDHERCTNPDGEIRSGGVDMRKLRSVERLTVMPEESPVGASAANCSD